MRMKTIALLLAAIASVMIFAGCSGNNYVPCCAKDEIASGKCILSDAEKTVFGDCRTTITDGTAICTNTRCSPGLTREQCAKNMCVWDTSSDSCRKPECKDINEKAACIASAPNCTWTDSPPLNTPNCGGAGPVYQKMPVCVDLVPKNCVNNKCTAMMCGFTGLKPSPPISSLDWDASKCTDQAHCSAYPTSEISGKDAAAATNLYKTSCVLRTMTPKLYNEVKSSRGTLWVNSFRFGVGSSFSDWEQAKNFFPVSDRFCSANTMGFVDRYVNYLGVSNTYCAATGTYYKCAANDLNFTERGTCLLYCNQNANDCQQLPNAITNYACTDSKMAYSERSTCFNRCEMFGNPGACTIDHAKYPFLDTDGRYKSLYQADYFWDTDNIGTDDGYDVTCRVPEWRVGWHDYCDDFYQRSSKHGKPWNYMTDGPWVAGTTWSWGPAEWTYRYTGTVDLDRGYYEKQVNNVAFPRSNYNYNEQLPFECKNSVECISGYCSMDKHKRGLIKKDTSFGLGATAELGCTVEIDGLSCSQPVLSPISNGIDKTGISYGNTVNFDIVRKDKMGNVEGGDHTWLFGKDTDFDTSKHVYRYYALSDTAPSAEIHSIFRACDAGAHQSPGLQVTTPAIKQCVRQLHGTSNQLFGFTTMDIIVKGDTDCSSKRFEAPFKTIGIDGVEYEETADPVQVWMQIYDVDFSKFSGSDDFGTCLIKDKTKPAYFDAYNLGWCEGCTYATMAVQRVEWPDWSVSGISPLMCYSWRGKYGYTPATGPLIGDSATPMSDSNGLQAIRSDPAGVQNVNGGTRADAAADWVRRSYSVDGAVDESNWGRYNGAIARSDWNDGNYWFTCEDKWVGGQSWWSQLSSATPTMPTPSAPYLAEKLGAYLRSNIMPILDVRDIDPNNLAGSRSGLASAFSSDVPGICSFDPNYIWVCKSNTNGNYRKGYDTKSACDSACGFGLNYCVPTSQPYFCRRNNFVDPSTYYVDINDCRPSTGVSECESAANGGGTCYTGGDRSGWLCDTTGSIFTDQASCEGGIMSKACPSGWGTNVSIKYNPTSICTTYGADGAAVYAVMDAERFADTALGFGWATKEGGHRSWSGFSLFDRYYSSEDPVMGPVIAANYLDLNADYKVTDTGTPDGLEEYLLGSKAEAINRAMRLKATCKNKPLVGLAISQSTMGQGQAARDYWTGTYSSTGTFTPGGSKLHQFFFKQGSPTYGWQVRNGKPDSYPNNVDLFLQDWVPKCNQISGTLAERTQYEVDEKMNFSRALLSNYSKPSIIWKFHFDDSASQCFEIDSTGKKNYSYFLEYLFNNTGSMVDAGMLGIIYDSWSAKGGLGYDATPNGLSGLTNAVATGALDNPVSGGLGGKATTPFCELQKTSKAVLGITKNSYGQKLVASRQACTCAECTESDYLSGDCKHPVGTVSYSYPNSLPAQMYCNDGNPCSMPSDAPPLPDFTKYRCPRTCVDEDKCVRCDSISTQSSFCRIDNSGEVFYESKFYTSINDDNWEFLAGLPAQDKCCLARPTPNGGEELYTYSMRSGNKQRTEFLQYPTRGEPGIDCGRVPDTSFLKYCNIRIPISSREAVCWKVPR